MRHDQDRLEGWSAVQGEIVLDHAVRHLAGHFIVWHLMLGEILCREARAIDAGRKLILAWSSYVEILNFRKSAVGEVAVSLDPS